eukprot:CAMPEP_0197032782 /NCGR_PEP_ID=MMETSP1384-20130603/11365_1 /TAXON_ID=29189 /ORGANISM="Ammonia sp." /LENGTH=365 /DNA_ID=CAMNT_0042462485 /DNA_START=39 /DNA_END=1136 /DNA_ORIENTATION=-
MSTIETPLTKLLGIKYPILLAGMNKAAGPKLAAAVTNAGGLGVIGGVGFTPRILKLTIKHLKQALNDPNAPFGVDLLIPKVGKGARKTNYDYTKGKLDQLIDVIIESGAKLFVSAVGVPPKHVVDRLHAARIPVMNMVGHPKHVKYALEAGVDIICAQGGEGGGHTGDVATSILLPQCVDLVRGRKMPLDTSQNVCVVGAGGIYDGRGLAMALNYGCQAVWVGTRFVCSEEAGASIAHKEAILNAKYDDTIRTLVYTGRPMRIVKNKYAMEWERNRQDEMKELLAQGVIPYTSDFDTSTGTKKEKSGRYASSYAPEEIENVTPYLSGQVAGCINDIKPAKQIIDEMMKDAISAIQENHRRIVSKL